MPKTETPEQKKFDIDAYLKHLTERPGVYRMLDEDDDILYVGKAKNLKRRVSSYFKKQHDEIKTRAMVAQIARVEVTVTDTESEALILENTLIKRYKPRYNILFRDDKSYPYVFVSTTKTYPSLSYHRGAKRRRGRYFGPFPNASAVHQTLHALQKIFPVRQCAESVFQNRSRPCLQYQIKRCSGPCIEGLVSKEQYDEDVAHTMAFLEGKSFEVIESLGRKMQAAAEALEFEKAGDYRDKIQALRAIQSQHLINQPGAKDTDVVALALQGNLVCVTVMMYRGGSLWGSEHHFPKAYRPKANDDASEKSSVDTLAEEVLSAFLLQHYLTFPAPKKILLSCAVDEKDGLEALLAEKTKHKVQLKKPVSQNDKGLMQLAQTNADSGLKQRLTQRASQQERLSALQEVLGLAEPPNHMECFDISHTQGQQTVASCVVFKEGVPEPSAYRKFNIEGIQGGDDYAAMHQALTRRYKRVLSENQPLPNLIVIDGGKGQLNQAIDVFKTMDLDTQRLVSVAKGEGRKVGLEILYTPLNSEGIDLESDDMALHLINYIRDEAHRFAITSHRRRRQKAQTQSQLQDIPGVGAKSRQKLLTHFGGLQEVKNAAMSELQKVPGISAKMAQSIYDFFHGEI
ncbi:MAG: excinuclease ABC subunit UvrC [Hydrogenovibrio sp.]|uniref:excinuclease ABC subunit UvrC n=1 Tax=Hydrogenovibrio sp. TaxID=2065821 RepID=UPI0028706679|nr:excinuclease ABC subunit UvrC [Hydrogenovibrio sp.]MDR9497756.1 excinuclease ABC subunit UvrC [Hydrogenovibrio sp.]